MELAADAATAVSVAVINKSESDCRVGLSNMPVVLLGVVLEGDDANAESSDSEELDPEEIAVGTDTVGAVGATAAVGE